MGAYRRAVKHERFLVGIVLCAFLHDPLHDAPSFPSAETGIDPLPWAVFRREVAPRRATPKDPRQTVYDPPVVVARSLLFAASFRRKQRRKTITHLITDIMSAHKTA